MSETKIKETKKEKKARKLEKKKTKESKSKKLAQVEEEETPIINSEEDESADESEVEDKPNVQDGSEVESDDDINEEGSSKLDEIAIDLNASVPLSKKQQRLLKKGKLDLDKLAKKHPAPKPELTEEEKAAEDAKPKKSEFGVWIGNLSFDTTREDIIRFITAKTNDFMAVEESTKESDLVKVEEEDITRFNLPKKERKIKGFAYVDFPSLKHVLTVVSLSEQTLNGRKLLIKNANSFEGRPTKEQQQLSKNPPSRILFVGNLSFDTTSELLEEHFRFCGDIVRIRMATFEDSGKCKGFAFIDFKDESGPTTALKSKIARKLINRPLRLEYGEDRSKRTPKRRDENGVVIAEPQNQRNDEHSEQPRERTQYRERPKSNEDHRPDREYKKRPRNDFPQDNKRLKSSVALATAQRASAAIVPSSGKKINFD
jgi:RNA recognition motif-containing protein